MTKREMFAEIRNAVIDNAEMVAFIDHEIELLNRKSTSPKKPTKTHQKNELRLSRRHGKVYQGTSGRDC